MYRFEKEISHDDARKLRECLLQIPSLRGSDLDTLTDLVFILLWKLQAGELRVAPKENPRDINKLSRREIEEIAASIL